MAVGQFAESFSVCCCQQWIIAIWNMISGVPQGISAGPQCYRMYSLPNGSLFLCTLCGWFWSFQGLRLRHFPAANKQLRATEDILDHADEYDLLYRIAQRSTLEHVLTNTTFLSATHWIQQPMQLVRGESSIFKVKLGCRGWDFLEITKYLHLETLNFIAFWEHHNWRALMSCCKRW